MSFANATENACTQQEIIAQESLILSTLEWKINLTNFSTWVNETTLNWDFFIEEIDFYSQDLLINTDGLKAFRFRDKNIQSFNLFRSLTQFVDTISLDVEYLIYSERILCISIIYLLMLKVFNMLDFSKIAFIQMEHIEQFFELNLLFSKFLMNFYSMDFSNIFEHIQYASCYMDSILTFEDNNQNEEIVIIKEF